MSNAINSREHPSPQDLYQIALYQKAILVCIPLYFLAFAGRMVSIGQSAFATEVLRPIYRYLGPSFIVVGLEMLVIALIGAVFVTLLAQKLYSSPVVFLLVMLLFVPLAAPIALLIISVGATWALQRNGVWVGIFGANLYQLRHFSPRHGLLEKERPALNGNGRGIVVACVVVGSLGLAIWFLLFVRPSQSGILLPKMAELVRKKDQLLENGGPKRVAEVEPLLKEFNDLHEEVQKLTNKGDDASGPGKEEELRANRGWLINSEQGAEFIGARLELTLLWRKLKRSEEEKGP